ncbi:hypothetical protein DdX_04099 [Ditylenchus destructor]|uniref:Uncharacterized protein n=1 Tax=Ditylenchus destructor TaxID=166010 RepID=A0AAD4NF05_9BILA|nr:hypothetical protein DdX_04099 [Ditylenchus destructor]
MSGLGSQHFVPSPDVAASIVIPTIVFCICMVVAMLIGINKCKQWELDKIVEMRRTRRVIQRITARLREKNFRTIQKARNMRKRVVNPVTSTLAAPVVVNYKGKSSTEIPRSTSPPPTYEDSLLDQLYYECLSELTVNNRRNSHSADGNRLPKSSSKSFKK